VLVKHPSFSTHKKINEFNKQKQAFSKIITVTHHSKLPAELPNVNNLIHLEKV
jgi:hypothetical protein